MRLLVVGIQLEKLKFDQKISMALYQVGKYLEGENELSDALVHLFKITDDYFLTPKDSLTAFAEGKVENILKKALLKRGVDAGFSFAITNNFAKKVFLKAPNFKKEDFHFGRYTRLLGGRIVGTCHCERTLHLDISNLFGYLLLQLDYLSIPSALFIGAIVICLVFLVRILSKEQQLNAIKNDFINNLTHELKTPVFSISLSSKIAKKQLEEGKPENTAKFLTLIENENEKLKTHIDKVLELATLENSHHALKKEPADLHQLIGEALENFDLKVKEQGGILIKHLEAKSHHLAVDKNHFKNAVHNLLENALKYSPEKVEIEVATRNGEGRFVLIINDKGIGIPLEHQKRIFEKFYRAPNKNLHPVKGFGLGLNYVQNIVKAHGGTVSVESVPGKGSTFTLSLKSAKRS